MAPAPTAVRVTVVPLRAPPTVIGAAARVSVNFRVPPVALMAALVVMPPAAESVRLKPPVPMVDAPFEVRACVSVRVTLPTPAAVCVAVMLGVARLDRLTAPVGLTI